MLKHNDMVTHAGMEVNLHSIFVEVECSSSSSDLFNSWDISARRCGEEWYSVYRDRKSCPDRPSRSLIIVL